MSLIPRFNYPVGTEVTLYNQKMALSSITDEGYALMNVDTGEIGVTSFSKFVELIKSPAMRIGNHSGLSTNVVELRLGGRLAAEQLAASQQEHGGFHHAVCIGATTLLTKLRRDLNDPSLELTGVLLNEPANRRFICKIATEVLGQPVNTEHTRGCRKSEWVLYKGRTILKYLKIFDSLAVDDDVIAALATRDHLKGNETRRIPHRLLVLMTQAWEEIGLDLKCTSVSNVHQFLEVLVREDNKVRHRNGLKPLMVPSQATLKVHREFLLTPTEYLVATKGPRHGRNKRGRGSTDFGALFVGQVCEADEVKLSLVTSAKERGYWENLSSEDQKAVEEIDKEIRLRFTLLVMIDVASRMPLAWVVSDQPKAEATLALLRMATRDKTKEKIKYGCSGDPAPAMAIGNVKTDNGVGLRAKRVIQALLGTAATFTAVRTYASADKPYVERLIGTTESILIKLIHGYTGRKAGELPGYDSVENGVLVIEELYEILTLFFIDEYPSMRHMGVGMGGRRPAVVIEEQNRTRGLFKAVDEDQRRIHLGWKLNVTPNDEGVCVFSGLWFNSDEFQLAVDAYRGGKVSVFVDPENVNEATALIPGNATIFRLQLQVTAYADLTVPEALELTQAYRFEHPDVVEIHEDRIASTRRKRHDMLRKISVEKKLSRSYSTFDECITQARHVFGGARIIPTTDAGPTVRPGEINSSFDGPGIFQIGDGGAAIEHQPDEFSFHAMGEAVVSSGNDAGSVQADSEVIAVNAPTPTQNNKLSPIGRPKTKGTFK